MKLSRRQVEIIRELREHPACDFKTLAQILDVSRETARQEVVHMEDVFTAYDIVVDGSAKGAFLVAGEEHLGKLLKEAVTMQEFSLERQILLRLLLQDGFITLQDLADSLFVSKSLLEKVMAVVLKKYEDVLETARRHGIFCIGTAMERRGYFVSLVAPYIRGIGLSEGVQKFSDLHFSLCDFLQEEEIKKAEQAAQLAQEATNYVFTDESHAKLFLEMLFAQYTLRCLPSARLEHSFLEELLEGVRDNGSYTALAASIAKTLGISDEAEILYLRYLFLTLRKEGVEGQEEILAHMRPLVHEILQTIQARFLTDFTKDATLNLGLSMHLYATLIREDRMEGSWLTAAIGRNYPLGLEMATTAREVIAHRGYRTLTAPELYYLTLHFQGAWERQRKSSRVRALVVCHYGLAAASLITARVEAEVPHIEIVGSVSAQRFQAMKRIDADLVLSTENLDGKGTPVLYVTPLLLEKEMAEIRHFVETRGHVEALHTYLLEAQVLDAPHEVNQEAALHFLSDTLQAQGIVEEGFFASLWEREQLSPTGIGGLAVPHGNPSLVKRSRLIILRFANPIAWGTIQVRAAFLFVVTPEVFQRDFSVLQRFYKHFAQREFCIKVRNLMAKEPTQLRQNLARLFQ